QKAKRLATLLGKSVVGIPANVGRFLAKRLKKHGVCAIHFGDPVSFDEWAEEHPRFLREDDRHARQAILRPFGEDLLRRIGRAIPVTPVAAVATAMVGLGAERMASGVPRGDLLFALRGAIDRLEAAKAPFFTGDPYAKREEERKRLERADGRHDLDFVQLKLSETDDLEEILERALDVMARRGLLFEGPDRMFRTHPILWDLVLYYANSVGQHLSR
ncbi:MAG: hypothetical protein QOC71_1253, partial [Thermoplasmata archaeon]|nr:hypothetical protein [Thermoplasmata archaeon]